MACTQRILSLCSLSTVPISVQFRKSLVGHSSRQSSQTCFVTEKLPPENHPTRTGMIVRHRRYGVYFKLEFQISKFCNQNRLSTADFNDFSLSRTNIKPKFPLTDTTKEKKSTIIRHRDLRKRNVKEVRVTIVKLPLSPSDSNSPNSLASHLTSTATW